VANNDDPLNIAIGNPNLKQSFTNNFNLSYNFYQVLKSQGLYVSLQYTTVNNAFSTFNAVDSLGRRIYQTVNVDGNYNASMWLYYNFKIKKPDLQVYMNFSPNKSRNKNFVNGKENTTNNSALSGGFGVSKYKEKKYNFDLSTDLSYNYSKSSINPDVVTKYWTIAPRFYSNFTLPKTIELSTDASYNWRQKTDAFSSLGAFIWNAGITKKISKKQDLKLGFEMHDILNQNIGLRRDVSTNFIYEKTYNVVSRYWLATLHWGFNKGPKKESEW
jgi:hypothetical protein